SLHLRNQGNQDVSSLLLRQVQKMERLFAGHHSRIRHRKLDMLRDGTCLETLFQTDPPICRQSQNKMKRDRVQFQVSSPSVHCTLAASEESNPVMAPTG